MKVSNRRRKIIVVILTAFVVVTLLFGSSSVFAQEEAATGSFLPFGGRIIWVWAPFTYPLSIPCPLFGGLLPTSCCPAFVVIVGPPRPPPTGAVAVLEGVTLLYPFYQYLVPGLGPKPPESPRGPAVKGNVWLPHIEPIIPFICGGALQAIQIGSSLL